MGEIGKEDANTQLDNMAIQEKLSVPDIEAKHIIQKAVLKKWSG